MKVYSIYHHDNNGNECVEVYTSEKLMNKYLEEDMSDVETTLQNDGYEAIRGGSNGYYEIWVPDSNIYYEWTTFESELKEDM